MQDIFLTLKKEYNINTNTNNNNNKPFIDLKCTYYTRMVAHCKYSYDWESEIFTTEIDIAHITNITHETQLLYEVRKKRDVVFP